MRPTAFCLAAIAVLALGACGGDRPASPASNQPIQAPKNTWTWVDFADSSCGDGTATGIGINPGDSPNVLVFLEGGGACWSYGTCFGGFFILTDGPFGASAFANVSTSTFQRSVLDRTEPENPFRDWSLVYVPYCTGDVHGGDNVEPYVDPQGGAHAFRHVGRANVKAFLRRVAATFPDAPKVAVVGTSAGGFGALVNYDSFRSSWPTTAQLYLIDDSGPPLQGSEAKSQVDRFDLSWDIYQALDGFCSTCRQDLSSALPALASRYPADRVSLLSYQRDTTIPDFFGISPDVFVERLRATADVIDNSVPGGRYFLYGGTAATGSSEGHTLLRDPGGFTLDGVSLWEFLRQQLNDDPSWISHAAP